MTTVLKVLFPEKCIGCELCVVETQKQLNRIGLDRSLIRIFRKKSPDSEYIQFSIDIDPRVNNLDLEKIRSICPTGVFTISMEQDG